MSGTDPFLTRWSRRKRQATEGKASDARAAPSQTHPAGRGTAASPLPPANSNRSAAAHETEHAVAGESKPAIDLTQLPPIESITSETDIRAFLQAGVPSALTRSALRRAWVADPAIRDFIGLSENSWDFTRPESVPGFGTLSADQARRLVATLLGASEDEPGKPGPHHHLTNNGQSTDDEREKGTITTARSEAQMMPPPEAETTRVTRLSDESHVGDRPPDRANQDPMLQREENMSPAAMRRGHGRALPK
jgi:hypothetical protein